TRRQPADRALLRVVAQLPFRPNFGQNLLEQEARILVRKRIVFIGAIAGGTCPGGEIVAGMAGIDEDPDRYRHVASVNEIVEHDWDAELAVFTHIGPAILE